MSEHRQRYTGLEFGIEGDAPSREPEPCSRWPSRAPSSTPDRQRSDAPHALTVTRHAIVNEPRSAMGREQQRTGHDSWLVERAPTQRERSCPAAREPALAAAER